MQVFKAVANSGLKNVLFVKGDYLSEGLFALGANKSK